MGLTVVLIAYFNFVVKFGIAIHRTGASVASGLCPRYEVAVLDVSHLDLHLALAYMRKAVVTFLRISAPFVDLFTESSDLFVSKRNDLVDAIDHPSNKRDHTRHNQQGEADSHEVEEANVAGVAEVITRRLNLRVGLRRGHVQLSWQILLLFDVFLHFVDSFFHFSFFGLL